MARRGCDRVRERGKRSKPLTAELTVDGRPSTVDGGRSEKASSFPTVNCQRPTVNTDSASRKPQPIGHGPVAARVYKLCTPQVAHEGDRREERAQRDAVRDHR